MLARIYRPAKTAMQSGLAKTKAWQDYDDAASSIKAAIGKLAARK